MDKTKEQLLIENEELHFLLAETEEMLAAIRNGEVDAIMVSGTKGEQVYSVSSAETPYRTFIEEMNEGAVTLSKDGIILYCNKRFAELMKESIEYVVGSYLKRFIIPKDKLKLDYMLAHRSYNKNDVLIVSLINKSYLKLSFSHLPSYLQGDTCILIATDISEMKNKEIELLELHNQLELHLDKIQRLRMQLIDKKIDNEIEINKLKNTNKKLVKEITKHKLAESGLKHKMKLKQKKV
ncbi:MAG: PAS domain-containing protein [Bacteroidales bacterium]|jgi:two-component system CheB/CheR fusion protein